MIGRDFFRQSPEICAEQLVGALLEWGPCRARIVETEAYDTQDDAACHTAFRRSARDFVTSHEPGSAYVYLNYGVHWMLNALVRGEREGFVLIRALEPLAGISVRQAVRDTGGLERLCSGPGKLTRALGIDGSDHGRDLCASPSHAFHRDGVIVPISRSERIGITRAVEKRWRFFATDHPCVSGRMQKQKAGRDTRSHPA